MVLLIAVIQSTADIADMCITVNVNSNRQRKPNARKGRPYFNKECFLKSKFYHKVRNAHLETALSRNPQ